MKNDSKARKEKIFLRVVVAIGLTAMVAYVCTSCYTTKRDKPKFEIKKPVSVVAQKAQELIFTIKR